MNVIKTTIFNMMCNSHLKDILNAQPRIVVVNVYEKLLNNNFTIEIKHILSENAFDMSQNTSKQRQDVLKELLS